MFFTCSYTLSGVAELHRWMVDVYNDAAGGGGGGGGGGEMGTPPSLKDATLFMHILDHDNHDNHDNDDNDDNGQQASDKMTVSYLSMLQWLRSKHFVKRKALVEYGNSSREASFRTLFYTTVLAQVSETSVVK
jgi:hypothetical protein